MLPGPQSTDSATEKRGSYEGFGPGPRVPEAALLDARFSDSAAVEMGRLTGNR